jgi:Flp pilus assembly protein TadD
VRSAQQYVALGDLAFSERRFGDAVSHYAKAIEYAPGDAVLYMLLSDALFATGDYHYSASALRKSLELEPRLVDTIVDKHAVYTTRRLREAARLPRDLREGQLPRRGRAPRARGELPLRQQAAPGLRPPAVRASA